MVIMKLMTQLIIKNISLSDLVSSSKRTINRLRVLLLKANLNNQNLSAQSRLSQKAKMVKRLSPNSEVDAVSQVFSND